MSTSDFSGHREYPEIRRHRGVAMHRPAEEGDLAPGGHTGIGDLLHPMDVRRETGCDHPPRGVTNNVSDRAPDRALRRLESRSFGVGGVSKQETHPTTPQRGEGRQVRGHLVDRCRIEFEIPRVDDHALRGVEGNRSGVGHRVADGDQLEFERPVVDPFLDRHHSQIGLDSELVDPAPGQLHAEPGPVDRDVDHSQEVGEGPNMVLMTVGDDDALHVTGTLHQPRPIRKDEVDPEHVLLGEHQTAVDQRDLAVYLDGGAVAPYLSQTP